MKLLFIILSIATVLNGCSKTQKEKLEQFIYDNSQILNRTVHTYKYDSSGQIIEDSSISYEYIDGEFLDSAITDTYFKYNKKGQLISVMNLPDSSSRIKVYNDFDSLIGDYKINRYGDTTFLKEAVYEGDKLVRQMDRMLFLRFPNIFGRIEKNKDLRDYDTTLIISEYIYDKNRHVRTWHHDKVNKITEETELFYENNQHTKSVTYSYLGDAKYVKETTFYGNKEDESPEMVSIGREGDTTALITTILKSDGKVIVNYDKEFDMGNQMYYDSTGQLIAIVMQDLNAEDRIVTKYTYDSMGNEILEVSYMERLNDSN